MHALFYSGFSICSILVCVSICVPVLYCFMMLHLYSIFWSQKCHESAFVILSQYCFGYSESSVVPQKFEDSTLSLWKMPLFDGHCVGSFGYNGHLKNINSSNPWTWDRKKCNTPQMCTPLVHRGHVVFCVLFQF